MSLVIFSFRRLLKLTVGVGSLVLASSPLGLWGFEGFGRDEGRQRDSGVRRLEIKIRPGGLELETAIELRLR
jgi:hypothetical protein